MATPDRLEELKILHQDLIALSHVERPTERLYVELESHIGFFRRLLDKTARNDQSRKTLEAGILDEEYKINEEFQQGTLQVADALNLDEVESARIFFQSQTDAEILGRSVVESSIIRFHQTRKYILDCLRLILQKSVDITIDEHVRELFQRIVDQVLQSQEDPDNGPKFVGKCVLSMSDIEKWLQDLSDKLNGANILGYSQVPEFSETIEYQRVSLIQQHESLGTIVQYLVRGRYSNLEGFTRLLDSLSHANKYDNLLVHYVPAISTYISLFGSTEGVGALREARDINKRMFSAADNDSWSLQYLCAGIRIWWLSEYSSWFSDLAANSPTPDVYIDEESKLRSKQFAEALKDGGFDFLLSLSADVKPIEWQDPARQGLRQWLQQKAPAIVRDSVPFSEFFQSSLMEQLEGFIDAFITNMPDILRKLRLDEDEQRQLGQTHDHDMDLEKFLVIISFTFEDRPEAAQAFWSDPDSNLAGFLHWASRRASTPLVSAFCEMLQALSEDEECATAAHEFLLGEGTLSSAKVRRSHSLTWDQIFKELNFFSSRLRDGPASHQSTSFRTGKQSEDQAEAEPESVLMLECYLRLIARLCSESATARIWLLKHPTFQLTDLLFQLASSKIPSRLRACSFKTLRALLTNKTREEGDFLWSALDVWISGGYIPLSKTSSSIPSPNWAMEDIFRDFGTGFEEASAFVHLLTSLVTPYEEPTELNDYVPFPELLGSASRMPGIDPYVDFAVGQVFGNLCAEITDVVQLRLLRLTCLDFITVCLVTFNEDLVIFGSKSNVVVDNAIRASDLAAYVRLHPFSRVMEWMFNDRVIDAVFAILHQDITEVGNALPDSPLVLCLLRAINVITLVMDLQATYLDIVRPNIKLQATYRRVPVSNAAYASFEDGILKHLSVVVDIGLYCGAGHAQLTVASLDLLRKLSAAPKLVIPPSSNFGGGRDRDKLIAALESSGDSGRIGRSLLRELDVDIDLDQGAMSDAYVIKIHLLDFLNCCLEASADRPTIAHLLLGFQCGSESIEVGVGSPLDSNISLFHSVLNLALQCPIGDEMGSVRSWLLLLKNKATQVLRTLWRSSLTSEITMTILRSVEFLPAIILNEELVDSETLWDGQISQIIEPTQPSSATCLQEFLLHRSNIFQYVAAELRQISKIHAPSLKRRVCDTLLGSTNVNGSLLQNATIFDLFDFMEFEIPSEILQPSLLYFQEIDLSICIKVDESDRDLALYDIRRVKELLTLHKSDLRLRGKLASSEQETILDNEGQMLLEYLNTDNQLNRLRSSRLRALQAWSQVLFLTASTGGLEPTNNLRVTLETFLVIQPKLERYSVSNLEAATILAALAKFLLFNINFESQNLQGGDLGHLLRDRLFSLFSVCLRAIHSPIANTLFREALYTICSRYITGVADFLGNPVALRKQNYQSVKTAGERLLAVICDDAYAGDETCRISALLFLDSLVMLEREESTKYIVESLARLNFIDILVESLKSLLDEFRGLKPNDLQVHLSYCHAKMALLSHISQSRIGATAVLTGGLFQSLKQSGVFATDPDIGLDIEDSSAVRKHYELLVALMRIVNAAILSKGSQNEQILAQARKFISENRLSIMTVFKRSAKLGGGGDVHLEEEIVIDLDEAYILLMETSGFLEMEGQIRQSSRVTPRAFT